MDAGNSAPVDTAIAAATGDLDLDEAGFTQNALDQPLESRRVELLGEDRVQVPFPLFLLGRLLRIFLLAALSQLLNPRPLAV